MASDQETRVTAEEKEDRKKRRKRRWGDATTAPVETAAPAPAPTAPLLDSEAKKLALQESIRARLAALKAKQQQPQSVLPAKRPTETSAATAAAAAASNKRAKVFDIDFSETAPTFQRAKEAAGGKPHKQVNPYLTSTSSSQQEEQDDAVQDERLVRASKPRSRHKPVTFVEPGKFVEIAERKRQKALNAAASGFTSGRKKGDYVAQSTMAQVYGKGTAGAEEDSSSFFHPSVLPERAELRYDHMPLVMEWWDMDLLPSKLKKIVAQQEGKALAEATQAQLEQLGGTTSTENIKMEQEESDQDKKMPAKPSGGALQELQTACYEQASLSYSKTAALVQHIVPIKPPHSSNKEDAKPIIHLTKRELKRQRKLRRQEKQRELQDRQAAGLEPPPEPRLTLKNFIRVLGDQAFLDPSQMEQKVMEQIQARQNAHLERNHANKLTKEQRAAKKTQKVQQDANAGGTKVALFFVQDMAHPYHRAKVDLNAQQNMITGGVLECENPPLACVIAEGGPKAIQRFKRLMTVRMKWTGTGEDDDDNEEEEPAEPEEEPAPTHKFNKDNCCALVWEGLVIKRAFPNFVFQSCETATQSRKVLKAKNVEHYWDQVMEHARGAKQGFQLKLVEDTDSEDDGNGKDGGTEEAMDES
jgi:U4/U6 small nuclear ribonucleoprotein PRP3